MKFSLIGNLLTSQPASFSLFIELKKKKITGIDFDGSSRVSNETQLTDFDTPDAADALNGRLRDIVFDMVRLGYI